ncbi:MAG: sensor histidine kinase [Candidatus Nanopelagicales bacterium]
MTLPNRTTGVQRILRVFGPYPIRPALLACTVGTLALLVMLIPATAYWWKSDTSLAAIITSALIAGVTWVWALVGQAWQRRHGVHWGSYLSFLVLAGIAAALVRTYYPWAPDLPSEGLGVGPAFIRSVSAMLLVNMLIGIATRRVQDQVEATQEALEIAREQQILILTADEDARRQISSMLHNRVQSELIAVSMEMRSVVQLLPIAEQSSLHPLIQRLETLRSLDLRNAARSLSPDLDSVDLQTAIEDLAMPFEASMLIVVDVDSGIDEYRHELGESLLLACYRIVEQGLLNVAAHAQAARVDIRVSSDLDIVRVSVVDDGIGLQEDRPRGLGSVVITTWVRAMEGDWRYKAREGTKGTELSAELRVTPVTATSIRAPGR